MVSTGDTQHPLQAERCKYCGIANTWEQLHLWKQAGLHSRPVAIGPAYLPGRTPTRSGWIVWSPWEPTDTDSEWYFHGKKHFSGFGLGNSRKESLALSLTEAMKWANDNYGPFNWARNSTGEYVPEQLQKKFPIRKRKD